MEIARLWFDFKGRINRGKYWFVGIANLLRFAAFVLVAVAAHSGALGVLAGLVGVPLFLSSMAIGVKRLHDRNKSAWWLLLFYLMPPVLNIVRDALVRLHDPLPFTLAMVFWVVSVGISIWAVIELGCLRGTAGPNRYGPDPLPA
jgi:uncharacterized membrane protein YhaH (DUF805 family)